MPPTRWRRGEGVKSIESHTTGAHNVYKPGDLKPVNCVASLTVDETFVSREELNFEERERKRERMGHRVKWEKGGNCVNFDD